jgi:hypothetical protein
VSTLPTPRDPYAAFRHRDFRLLFMGRVITTFAGDCFRENALAKADWELLVMQRSWV